MKRGQVAERAVCSVCGRLTAVNRDGWLRFHYGPEYQAPDRTWKREYHQVHKNREAALKVTRAAREGR